MNTTQIQHQFAVNVEPEVIVAGKLEDDVVSPVIHAIRRLSEYGGKLHAVVIVGIILRNRIQWLSLARVCVRKLIASNIAKISDYIAIRIMGVSGFGADIIIGHELAMNSGITCSISNRAKLIVDGKVPGFISV